MAATNAQAITQARKFVRDVQRVGVQLDAAYLYGSYAAGTANADSDIDIALVSQNLTGGVQDLDKLGAVMAANDNRIENVRFHPRDFQDENPLVWEIKAQGIPLIRPRRSMALKQRLNVNSIRRYWLQAARQDWKTASELAQDKRHQYALVFGKLYLEKLLKAIIVKQTRTHAPYRVTLTELAHTAGLEFSDEQMALLARVNEYNRERMEEPENRSLRKNLTFKFSTQELKEIHALGTRLQAHAK